MGVFDTGAAEADPTVAPTGAPHFVQKALSPVLAVPHFVQKLAIVFSLSLVKAALRNGTGSCAGPAAPNS
jgi:hypothetical protein